MTTQKYRAASRQLLAQARSELHVGDVRQASEKGWGAAAQMVKAVAEQRGWEHDSHALLFAVVRDIQRTTGDPDLRRLFRLANALHINFYEDWLDRVDVAEGLDDVERLLDKIEPVLG